MVIKARCLTLFCLLLLGTILKAQNSLIVKEQFRTQMISNKNIFFSDSLKKKEANITALKPKKTHQHNPKLAVIMSTVLPGSGQIYNRKYWKTPIIWVGMGACAYFIRSNHLLYKDYKSALLQRSDTSIKEPDKYLDVYSTDQLLTLQDQYRQNRDLFIIATSLVYVLNIVDALVDAHLFTFDVSDDLSIHWQPYYQNSVYAKANAGFNLQLKF